MSAVTAYSSDLEDQRVSLRASLTHIGALTRRNLLRIKADPESLADVILMPIIFTTLFAYVFGGAITGGQTSYLEYMVPGILGTTCMQLAMSVGTGLNTDFTTGLMDRFRTLPIGRSSVLVSRLLSETLRALASVVILLGFAMLLGMRIHTNPLSVLAGIGLTLAFGSGLVWVSMLLGMAMKSPQAVQGVGMLVLMPLQFGSSIFAPTNTMPGWLQAFTKVNPLSILANAERGLFNGGPVLTPSLQVLAWAAGLTVVFAPLAVMKYKKRS